MEKTHGLDPVEMGPQGRSTSVSAALARHSAGLYSGFSCAVPGNI